MNDGLEQRKQSMNYNPIMLAMDVADIDSFDRHLEQLTPYVGTIKIGLEAMMQFGPKPLLDNIHAFGNQVFLDGKFCDIPNTVGKASQVVADMGVEFFNVHANCGMKSIEAAAKVKGESKLLVVTVLTSMSDADTQQVFSDKAHAKVKVFARMALDAGADGIVCSPQELKLLHSDHDLNTLLKVTPGIRPSLAATDDQHRTLSAAQALQSGADYLVIGRPITQAENPAAAAKKILDDLEEDKG